MCVDDDPEILDLCELYMGKSKKIKVIKVASPRKALDIFRAAPVDAIISDYRMPEMDGIALLKQVRALSETVPFVLLTGKGDEEVAMVAMNLGANLYIKKSGSPREKFLDMENQILRCVEAAQSHALLADSLALWKYLCQKAPIPIAIFSSHLVCEYGNDLFLGSVPDGRAVAGLTLEELFPGAPGAWDEAISWLRSVLEMKGAQKGDPGAWDVQVFDEPAKKRVLIIYGITPGGG
jgi:CheY-like chemotaxis protein